MDVEGGEPARELDISGTVVAWGSEAAQPEPSVSQEPVHEAEGDAESTCPVEVRYALAPSREPAKARMIIEGDPSVVSALRGVVTDVDTDEESGWARVRVHSSDMALTYQFYLDSARDRLPAEGDAVAPGDVIGGAHEVLHLEAARADAGDPLPIARLLDEWDCREGLPEIDVLQARLMDGSVWEIRLSEPIEVIATEGALLTVISRWTRRSWPMPSASASAPISVGKASQGSVLRCFSKSSPCLTVDAQSTGTWPRRTRAAPSPTLSGLRDRASTCTSRAANPLKRQRRSPNCSA